MKIIKERKNIDINTVFAENKYYFIALIFYLAGIFTGTLIYKNLDSNKIEIATNSIIQNSYDDFLHLFLTNSLIYTLLLTTTLFIGMSLIGYLLINFVPLLYGFEIAVRLCYYYTTYSNKGIGYSLLLIIPQTTLIITILLLSTKPIGELSKNLLEIVLKNEEFSEEINIGLFCKKTIIIYIIMIIASAINSLLLYFLNSLITL